MAVATVIGEKCAVKAEECGKVVTVVDMDMALVVIKTDLMRS